MKVWEGKQVVGFLLTWRLLRPQLQQQTTDKYHCFQVVTLIRMYFNSLHFHDAWSSTSTNVCTIFSHLSVFLSRLELLNRNIWDDITIWTIYNITICCVKYWQKGRAWIVDFAGADPGFGQGGAQLLRLKVADVAKRSRANEASNLRLGSRARLRALEAFGFLMLKYAFSHILETLFLSFLTSILIPKVDKNRTLEFTSINLRHSYILHLFFNLHEKVMLWLL